MLAEDREQVLHQLCPYLFIPFLALSSLSVFTGYKQKQIGPEGSLQLDDAGFRAQ